MENGINRNNRAVYLPKCKQLCANKCVFVDFVAVTVSVFEIENMTFAVTRCKNASHFSTGSLKMLLHSSETEVFDSAVAYSVDGNDVKYRSVQLFETDKNRLFALSALFSELCFESFEKTFSLFDVTYGACYFLRIFSDFAVIEDRL